MDTQQIVKDIQALKAKHGNLPVIQKGLDLVSTLIDDKTPVWLKGIVVSALLYLINPFDVIPDLAPYVGWVDDLSILVAALAKVAQYNNGNSR